MALFWEKKKQKKVASARRLLSKVCFMVQCARLVQQEPENLKWLLSLWHFDYFQYATGSSSNQTPSKTCGMMMSQTDCPKLKGIVRQLDILSDSTVSEATTDFWVRWSISRLQCLPTHDSTNTHKHHHNFSIIHHPLQPVPFFWVISPIPATLVKIFPKLMMCHREDYYWTTACCSLELKDLDNTSHTCMEADMWNYPPTL